jgi:hypothetical protein
MDDQEKDAGVIALADALALSHLALDAYTGEDIPNIQRAISAAMAMLLNLHEADKLSAHIIALQEAYIARLLSNRAERAA